MSELEYTEQGWRLTTDTTRHHRYNQWDYKGEGIYHITMVVDERFPLFGELTGDTPDEARIALNPFGKKVDRYARDIPSIYANKGLSLKVLALQVMPNHVHIVLQVLQPMSNSVGQIVRGFKSACTSLYKRDYFSPSSPAGNYTGENDNLAPPQAVVDFARIFTSRGSIWQYNPAGYHERILCCRGELDAMINYVKDNPRRLWLKRANPDLFRIRRQTKVAGVECTTLGNIFLAERPLRAVLQCSRTLTQAEIDAKREQCLAQADNGTVFISAAISEGEKQISRALRRNGYPMIILLQNGFPKPGDPHERYYKPGGEYFNACANEQLLLIEPSEALYDAPEVEASVYRKAHDIPHTSRRYRFLALNAIAWMIEK